jgi:hypothetical protein
MDFRILGPLAALHEGRPVGLGGSRQRALLAVFLLGESTWDIGPMSITRPGVIVDLYPGEAAARADALARAG